LVAAVIDRATTASLGRSELYGATSGGVRVDDPATDLALAVALWSSATGVPAPPRSAFIGEVSLTGQVRSVPGMQQRLSAAKNTGIETVFAPETASRAELRVVEVRHVRDAMRFLRRGQTSREKSRTAEREEVAVPG
jgi:DNA repair protein RadA/Sms